MVSRSRNAATRRRTPVGWCAPSFRCSRPSRILIAVNAPSLIGLLPRIEGNPVLPVVGFAAADLILLALSWWDWRANRRLGVFPVALAVLLVYHAGTLALHRVPAWNAFAGLFVGLPLS